MENQKTPEYEVRTPSDEMTKTLAEIPEINIPMFISGSICQVNCINQTLLYRDFRGALVMEEQFDDRGVCANTTFVWYTFC